MDRWIVVDNTNNGLKYSGSWTSVSGAQYDSNGNFGRTYLTTLQSLSSGQGTISYTFRGTSGRVYGTNNIAESNGSIDPSWDCALDGKPLSMPGSFPYGENNWILCEWSDVSDGTHTITITARSNGRAFLFDYFIYTPSTSQTLQNVVTGVSWRDSSVQYGKGWDAWGGSGYQGKDAGAVMTFPFYGTGVTFMGLTPIEAAAGESQAEYFIDDQSPTRFVVPGRSPATEFHRIFFRTSAFSLGHHTLTVIYRGQAGLMPLVFGNLLIESSTFPPPTRNSDNNGGGGVGGGGGGVVSADSPGPTGSPNLGSNNGTFGGLPDQNSSRPTATGGIVVVTTTAADGSVRTTSVRFSAGGISSPSGGTTQPSVTATPDSLGVGGDRDNTIFLGSGAEKNKPPIGAIIGGVLGTMALIGFFILAILKHRASNRRKRDQELHSEKGHFQPFNTTPDNAAAQGHSQSASEHAINPYYSDNIYQGRKGAIVAAGGYVIPLNNRSDGAPSNTATSDTASSDALISGTRAQPQLSKQEEAREGSGDRMPVIVHADSGYRMPVPAGTVSNIHSAEYPPLYTAS